MVVVDRTNQGNFRTVRWGFVKDYRRAGLRNILNLG